MNLLVGNWFVGTKECLDIGLQVRIGSFKNEFKNELD